MAILLEFPLPDEILVSVAAAYVTNDEVHDVAAFCRRLFGDGIGMPVAIVTNLRHVEVETRRTWGMTAAEIRDRLTLFPYYAAFWSKAKVDFVAGVCIQEPDRATLDGPIPWSANALGTCVYGLGIRYCKACWYQDDAEGTRRYWRRAHQLPGVVTCHVHGGALTSAGAGAKGMFTARRPRTDTLLETPGSPFQRAARHKVSVLSAAILQDGAAALRFGDSRERLDCLRSLGYGASNRNLIDEDRLIHDVIHAFGKNYLELVHLVPKGPRSWIHGCVCGRSGQRKRSLPIVMMDVFLSAVVGRVEGAPGPVCPAAESPDDPRHRLLISDALDDRFHCLCSCGHSFLFEEDGRGQSRRLEPTSAGPDFARAAAILDEKGWPRETIARVFGVSERSLAHWMRFRAEASVRKVCLERARLLVRWIELVHRSGGTDGALAENGRLWRSVRSLWASLPQDLTPLDCRD